MLDKTLIIGFGYKARQGKDTCVQSIIEARSDKFDIRRYAFADALKEEVAGKEFELCLKLGLPYEPDNKHRKLLQHYGTNYRRAQDPHYWIKKLMSKLNRENPQVALISDVRFMNEINFIKSFSGYVVKVERARYVDLETDSSHPSEADLDGFVDWDATVSVLDGEVSALKRDAVTLFDYFVGLLDNTPLIADLENDPLVMKNV